MLVSIANVASAALVTQYQFNAADGATLVDSVAGHNAGIGPWRYGTGDGYVAGHDGTAGGAYNFNGVVAAWNSGGTAMPGGDAQTVSFWYKSNIPLESWSTGTQFYSNSGALNYLDMTNHGDATFIADSGYADQIPANLEGAFDGEWHLITTVKGGGVMTVYLDTTAIATGSGHSNLIPASGATFIGAAVWGNTQIVNGAMDDFRVYNNALTANEVAALVPEPATMALLGLGALVLRRRSAR